MQTLTQKKKKTHIFFLLSFSAHVSYSPHTSHDPIVSRLVRSCHTKCISNRYAEPDLNKGESVCVDRSASHLSLLLSPLHLFFLAFQSWWADESFSLMMVMIFVLFFFFWLWSINWWISCVDKFFNVNAKVGERMQAKGSAASTNPTQSLFWWSWSWYPTHARIPNIIFALLKTMTHRLTSIVIRMVSVPIISPQRPSHTMCSREGSIATPMKVGRRTLACAIAHQYE